MNEKRSLGTKGVIPVFLRKDVLNLPQAAQEVFGDGQVFGKQIGIFGNTLPIIGLRVAGVAPKVSSLTDLVQLLVLVLEKDRNVSRFLYFLISRTTPPMESFSISWMAS